MNDAEAVASLLSRNEDESLNFDVQTILNGNATRKSVLSNIHRAFDDYADHGLLYFSGHGSEDSSGSHLVRVDFRDSGTISISEIVAILASSKVVNKTIIFDSCYSGGAGDVAGTNAGQARYHAARWGQDEGQGEQIEMARMVQKGDSKG